jgi:hypothetical protein
VFALRIAPERNDGVVLDDDPRVRIVAACDAPVQLALQRENFAIRPVAEVD